MIINWKRKNAGLLTLPCMKDGQRLKVIHVLPGHNEVNDEDWEQARPSALDHIKAGNIVELLKEKLVEKVKEKASDLPIITSISDFFTKEVFPYMEVIKMLKSEDVYSELTKIKKEETGRSTMSKDWLLDYIEKDDEIKNLIIENMIPNTESENEDENEDAETTFEKISLTDMDGEKAAEIIADTFNMETLEQWQKEIAQPDLRVLILNQIEKVKKPAQNKGN